MDLARSHPVTRGHTPSRAATGGHTRSHARQEGLQGEAALDAEVRGGLLEAAGRAEQPTGGARGGRRGGAGPLRGWGAGPRPQGMAGEERRGGGRGRQGSSF